MSRKLPPGKETSPMKRIEYILNDHEYPSSRNKETSFPWNSTTCQEKFCRRSKDFAEETKLADDIDSILGDKVIDQMSSGRGPITKKVRRPKRLSAAKRNYFKDDEDIVNNVGFFFNDDILQSNHKD